MTDKTSVVTEQRRHPRTPLGVTLNIRQQGAAGATCRGVIADLSQGGMTFKTDALLEEGMSLHLKLPSSLEIRGEVRHVGGSVGGQRRYGVRFHKIGFIPTH